MKVSVIIPVYNEEATIQKIIEKVMSADFLFCEKEIIVIDDCSTDNTFNNLKKYEKQKNIKIVKNSSNKGKGFSVREGIKTSSGDVILIQDADLEYDPQDYPKLLKPIIEEKSNTVYGSRFTGEHNNLFFTHWIANKFITFLIDVFFNTTLSDVEVGYKVFKKSLLNKFILKENRFAFEIEITAKVLKLKEKIFEVPISYTGRDYNEGKKIGWKDGIHAIWCILRYRLFN